jgi:alkylation response protein AidB-like acyl-CoA dehydrogenase
MIAGNDKELKLMARASAEFSKKELAPTREENDQYPFSPFFDNILKKAYDLDFLHVILPENYGGIGQTMSALCIILSNICQEDSSLGGIIFTNIASQELMLEANAGDLLTSITNNAETVSGFLTGLPVFNHPSDIENTAFAEIKDDHYILSGRVEYVACGSIAKQALIPAKIKGNNDISFFLIDLTQNTVSASEPVHSLGIHACPAVDITFNNAIGLLVGKQGQGNLYFDKMTDRMSVAAAAMSWGIMKGSFEEASEYAKGRFQGGRKIIDWSEIRMMLSEMAISIKVAESVISRTCQAIDIEESGWQACARSAAIRIQEDACALTTDGIQVLGGVGYMKDFGQEKRFRDAKHIQALLGMTPMKKLRFIENMIR